LVESDQDSASVLRPKPKIIAAGLTLAKEAKQETQELENDCASSPVLVTLLRPACHLGNCNVADRELLRPSLFGPGKVKRMTLPGD
jgi:hypothetical protein